MLCLPGNQGHRHIDPFFGTSQRDLLVTPMSSYLDSLFSRGEVNDAGLGVNRRIDDDFTMRSYHHLRWYNLS